MDILWKSLTKRKEITIQSTATGKFHTGIVNSIQAEDGSGRKFNVVMNTGEKLFVSYSF